MTREEFATNRIPETPPRNFGDLAKYLAAFTNFEKERALPTDRRVLGPERCAKLIDAAGGVSPELKVVQVAGSKGKGSTVLWLEALLLARGHRVVATLSPHLESLNERLRLDGEVSDPQVFCDAIARLHPALLDIETRFPELRPTFFDVITAAVTREAVERGAEILLLEVGLGGPLDSSSAVPHDVGVLTAVDLEHRAQLGDTVEEIAAEKARIARPGKPFLIAASSSEPVEAVVAAARVGGKRSLRQAPSVVDGFERGSPQGRNLALAAAVVEALNLSAVSPGELEEARERLNLPGRLELIEGTPPLLLDGAHTPRSLAAFAEHFRAIRAGRSATIVIGALNDKEWRDAFQPLADLPDVRWIATSNEEPRSIPAEELATRLQEIGISARPQTLENALDELIHHPPPLAALTGSFRLAGRVRELWKKRTPTD